MAKKLFEVNSESRRRLKKKEQKAKKLRCLIPPTF
jgi:hypothetical protein